jgi:hypothetical protein
MIFSGISSRPSVLFLVKEWSFAVAKRPSGGRFIGFGQVRSQVFMGFSDAFLKVIALFIGLGKYNRIRQLDLSHI